MICRACSAAASAPAVSPIASSDVAVSLRAAASLRLSSGVTSPDLMSCSCSARARPRMSLMRLGGDSHDVAEPLRQVEDQTVGGFCRCRERRFGALALLFGLLPLLVCDPLLLDGNSALPISEPGKRQRDDKPGREAPGEDVAPPGGAASARGDEGLRLRGRLRRAAGA